MQSLPILHQQSPPFLIGKEYASPEYPLDILFRAVMIEAKQSFAMLYKYDLVVPWQCVDIGREVNKVKSIILSKISFNIYCGSDTIVLTDSCLKDLLFYNTYKR